MSTPDLYQPGELIRNAYGRYELNSHELTSGSPVEVQRGERWEVGRVEFDPDEQDYVILLSLGGTMRITPTLRARLTR